VSPYAKAIYAAISCAIVAFLSALSVVLVGDTGIDALTQGQWVAIALATLAGAGITGSGTYAVTNKPSTPVTGGTTL